MAKKAGLLAGAALSVLAGSAAAQVPTAPPPVREVIDDNGVDLFRGDLVIRQPLLTIGADQGLSYDMIYRGNTNSPSVYGRMDRTGSTLVVTINGQADRFTEDGATYTPTEQRGQALTWNSAAGTYTYTARDGTVVVFQKVAGSYTGYGSEGRISSIASTDGATLTYTYVNATYQSCSDGGGSGGGGLGRVGGGSNVPERRISPDRDGSVYRENGDRQLNSGSGRNAGKAAIAGPGGGSGATTGCTNVQVYRLSSISNSYGYRLTFTYAANDPADTQGVYAYLRATGVTASNLAGCAPATTCSWPTLDLRTAVVPANVAANSYTVGSDSNSTSYGRVTAITRYGAASPEVTIGYTDSKVSTVTDQLKTLSYTYADTGNERAVKVRGPATTTSPSGVLRVYRFYINDEVIDGVVRAVAERLKSVTDEVGNTTTYTYTSQGYVESVTYPRGISIKNEYDDRGNVKKMTRMPVGTGVSPLVTITNYEQNCSGTAVYGPTPLNAATCNLPRQVSDERSDGNYVYTDYTYNGDGTTASVKLPAPTTAQGAVRPEIRYTYQSLTPTGGQAINLLATVSQCRTLSSCTGTADERKQTFTYTTDRNLLPASVTVAAGDGSISSTTTTTYDAIGNLISTDGPVANDTTTYLYDGLRRRIGVLSSDPDNSGGGNKRRAQRLNYNAEGGSNPDGDWTLDSVEIGTVADNATDLSSFSSLAKVEYSQYVAGQPMAEKRSIGGNAFAVTHSGLSPFGRVNCVTQRLNPAEWNTYQHPCSRQPDGPDGRDRMTRWQYDDAGRVTNVSSGYMAGPTLVSTDTYTYTASGQVKTVTDGNNNTTTYDYDNLDRPEKVTYPATATPATATPVATSEQLVYDVDGTVKTRQLRDGSTIEFTYDRLGRLTGKVRAAVGANGSFGYGYDNFGNITSATSSWPTITRTYDALSRLTGESSSWLRGMTWEYDAAGRRTKQSWDDGFFVTYAYDNVGELKTISEKTATGTAVLATYWYDDLGRRTSLFRGLAGSPVITTTYAYASGGADSPYLTSLVNDVAGTAFDLTSAFTYNLAGQIKTVTRSNPTDKYAWTGHYNVNRPYEINGLNQVTTAGPASNKTTFGYDARGNLTSSGTTQAFSYAAENELASVAPSATATPTSTLTYDPFGQLIYVESPSESVLLHRVNGEIATELTWDGAGGTKIVKRYVQGAGADEPIASWDGPANALTNKRYFVADERGSIIASTGAAGGMPAVNTYDEYGIPASTNTGRFGYTGQAWFAGVGLYDYKSRMYSPTLGRFMQTDPIGYSDGTNMYAYVGGDPVNATDPDGHKAQVPTTHTGSLIPGVIPSGIDCSGSCIGVPGTGYWQPSELPSGSDGNGGAVVNGGHWVSYESFFVGSLTAQVGSLLPQRGRYPTICQRRDWHNLKVSEKVAALRAAGFTVAENVRIARFPSLPSSYAVADYIARAPGSTPLHSIYYLGEVKTGDADLTPNQRINYYSGLTQIRSSNAENIGLLKNEVIPVIWNGVDRFPGCPNN